MTERFQAKKDFALAVYIRSIISFNACLDNDNACWRERRKPRSYFQRVLNSGSLMRTYN